MKCIQDFSAAQLILRPVPQPSTTNSSANLSIQPFNSTSSSTVLPFSYIIPYGISQECNIYGPICQTGSITVGVNLTYATTTSVLPCSSYLKAQSQYLQPPDDSGYDIIVDGTNNWPNDWLPHFGRSPECKSYAEAYSRQQFTFPGCSTSSVIHLPNQAPEEDPSYPWQIPPGVIRRFSPEYTGYCCGNCSLNLTEVRLYYFPDSTITDCHNNTSFNHSSVLSSEILVKREHSLIGDGSIAVVSGHTL